ncbi:hypothetical protein Csa_001805 [Cucumis sativus]|nr:hypothetical protein Csa_001805 [Cucumis sativus]
MDSNQFVADEDDGTFSCCVSGALLLEEIVGNCGLGGINAIKVASLSQKEKRLLVLPYGG